MFLVAARRGFNSREDDADLRGFIDRQIEIAKAPAKTHALVRSGASTEPAKGLSSAIKGTDDNRGNSIEIVQREANPLAIAIKERSHAYLSASYPAPSDALEPRLKQTNLGPEANISPCNPLKVPIHAPDYSAGRLDDMSATSGQQPAPPILLPRSSKRWNVQRNPNTQRAAESTRVGLAAPVGISNFELKTKENLIHRLDEAEQWLKPLLDCAAAASALPPSSEINRQNKFKFH